LIKRGGTESRRDARTLPTNVKFAIIAALEREIHPLVQNWHAREQTIHDRPFRFFEHGDVVAVCGGIGVEAARRAAVAAISLYQPQRLISAGFAGSLDPALRVGAIFCPQIVINASDGSRIQSAEGQGVLVTFSGIAGADQKSKLARAFQAQAVDMEAAAVGQAASAAGIAFSAVKAISDEAGFDMPLMDRYVDANGQFQTAKFALAAAVRPWRWNRLRILARNSNIASRALCEHLAHELL